VTEAPTHSKLDSPSAASRTEACPGSVALTMHLPDTRSAASDAGTVTHWLAAQFLENPEGILTLDATGHGKTLLLACADWLKAFPDGLHDCPDVSQDLRVTEDMCAIAQTYVDYCRRESQGAEVVFVEHRVAFNESLGVDGGAEGTIDFLALWPDRVLVVDLKAGYTQVMAGSQLKRYALGVREQYGHLADFETFTLAIVQPKLDHIDEITRTDTELDDYQVVARQSAADVRWAIAEMDDPKVDETEWQSRWLMPGEDQCKWCKAKAWCPALAKEVAQTVGFGAAAGMDDLTRAEVPPAPALGMAMSKVGMIENWCKAVRAEVERELIAGNPVEGYKLVQGRKGARAWVDEHKAEDLMRTKFRFKVDEVYDLKLISPTVAEKRFGEQSRRWSQLQALIGQNDGKPSVAPVSDKRPAIRVAPNADGMETIDVEGARLEQLGEDLATAANAALNDIYS